MRTRSAVLAVVLGALVALGAPVLASAAPHRNRGLTVNSTPNPINAGQGVFIYGQLQGTGDAGQAIRLYHRIAPASRFSLIGITKTNQYGFYEFTRQEGIVMTNRSWFVRGPNATHSLTIHERVAALVTLTSNAQSTVTGRRVIFSGQVTPRHPVERVLLQQQTAAGGNTWRTIASTFTNRNSRFTLAHTWARPGTHTLRAYFAGDPRNVAAGSDSVTVIVQQRERPAFTLTTSRPIIPEGTSATLTGTLDRPGTSTAEAGVPVTLYGVSPAGHATKVATTTTGSDGSYSFTVTPTHNTVYRATTRHPGRSSAPVHQGVQDVVTISSSSGTSTVGGSVVLSGTVAPLKAGHTIFLQRLGNDGAWHDVASTAVTGASTYRFTYRFGQDGKAMLRARIFGGPWNVGAASPVETVDVSGVAPLS